MTELKSNNVKIVSNSLSSSTPHFAGEQMGVQRSGLTGLGGHSQLAASKSHYPGLLTPRFGLPGHGMPQGRMETAARNKDVGSQEQVSFPIAVSSMSGVE